jgi:HEAT repeat protein
MSKKTRKWTAGMSLAVSSAFLLMLGWGTAEENKKDIWRPFLSEGELKKLIDEQIAIMKEELTKREDGEKIQNAALLIAVAVQNWNEPKDPRQAASVRDAALQLAKMAKEEQWTRLDSMVNRLGKFKEIPGRSNVDKRVDWDNHFFRARDAMPAFNRDGSKGDVTAKEFMALVSTKKPLDREQMTEKLQLMAYKSALIAEVTKDFYKARAGNFQKWAENMRETSLDLATAIKTKKERDAKKAILKLSKSCIACHEVYLGRPDVAELVTALRADYALVRQSAAVALGDYGYAAEMAGETVQPRESGSLEDFRRRLKPAILPLIEALKDKKENVRFSAKEALQKIGLKPEVPAPVINQALRDSDEYVRFWFAYTFRDLGDKHDKVSSSLMEALKNPDKDIRSAAAEILGRNASQIPDARRALKDALNDKDPDVRGTAAKALRQIGKESDIPALIQALKDTDPIVRANAAIALAQIGGAAIPELRKVLKDPNQDAQASAAYALGRIGPKAKSAETELREMLKEKDEYLRLTAGAALAKISPTLPKPD